MPKNRQSQHRPARDTAKSKELADLRKENHQLKQQVARTRKLATRAVESDEAFRGFDRSSTIPMPEMKGGVLTRESLREAANKMRGACPCGGRWRRLELGPKVLEVCDQCTARRVVKTDPI